VGRAGCGCRIPVSIGIRGRYRLVGFNADVWWTGLADPTDVMREAVAPLLARGDFQP
jgi:hypothetical protein